MKAFFSTHGDIQDGGGEKKLCSDLFNLLADLEKWMKSAINTTNVRLTSGREVHPLLFGVIDWEPHEIL